MPARSAKSMNFTKTELAKLKPPATGFSVYHDTAVEGLVILVYSTGGSRFYVYKKIEGKPTRIKIGKFPDISVEIARKKAQDLLGSIARGEPIKKVEKETAISLEKLLAQYLGEYATHHCKTWKETRANFTRYFSDWLERPVDTISHNEVQQRINDLGGERGAPHFKSCF